MAREYRSYVGVRLRPRTGGVQNLEQCSHVRNLREPAEAKHCVAPATWLSDTRLVGDGLTRPAKRKPDQYPDGQEW